MSYARGVVLVVLAAMLWSLMGLLIRAMEAAGVWAILFWRSLFLIPVLVAWLAFTSGGRPLAAIRAAGRAGLVGGAGLVVAFAGAIHAIQTTTIANAVFLFAASPLLAALIGRAVLGERVRPHSWVAIAVALVGVAVMVREGLALGGGWGTLTALLSAAGFAVFTVALRAGRRGDMLPAVLIGGVLSAAVGAAAALATGAGLAVPARDLGLAALMGAGILGLGMTLYTAGSRSVPAVDLTLLSMIEVLLAPLWAFLVLGEGATAATLAGGAIVLAAIAGNALAAARPRAAPTEACQRAAAGPR
jgi:drug/metabolite transporter (DMT)-like permease